MSIQKFSPVTEEHLGDFHITTKEEVLEAGQGKGPDQHAERTRRRVERGVARQDTDQERSGDPQQHHIEQLQTVTIQRGKI